MALSLDDRLLGEKMDNYCSSSEDEDAERASSKQPTASKPEVGPYKGFATNVSLTLNIPISSM